MDKSVSMFDAQLREFKETLDLDSPEKLLDLATCLQMEIIDIYYSVFGGEAAAEILYVVADRIAVKNSTREWSPK